MGICSAKCSYYSPQEAHLWRCCSHKIARGLRDCRSDTAQLLACEEKYVVSRNAKSEEEVFGYSIISQDSPRFSKHMAKTDGRRADRNVVVAAGDVSKTLIHRNDERAANYIQAAANMDLTMYIVTWNMNGKALVRSIAKLLDVDGERYDLYVIGLQEAHTSVAESVITEALGEKYSFVAGASMTSLELFIVAKKTVLPFLSRPLVDKVSTGGLGGLAGRQKGAVAITLRFKDATLLFIACHLAPHQSNVRERNAQYHRISEAVFAKQAQVVAPFPGGVCSGCSSYRNGLIADEPGLCEEHPVRATNSKFMEQADVVVWMGDLNYRVEMSRSSVTFLIRHKLEEVLWSKDQLTKALKKGHAFIGFEEGPLSFRPTYKYDVGTDNYDTSSKERVPSWTDRILFKVGQAGKLKVHMKSYTCINSIKSSDHRPVKALLTLSPNREKVKYPS